MFTRKKYFLYRFVILVGGWLLYAVLAFSQSAPGKRLPVDIYIFPDYYNDNVVKYLNDKGFSVAHMLMTAAIDPDKDQQVNVETVKQNMMKFYPEANATGLYIIDWEGPLFNDLKLLNKNDKAFRSAEAAFIRLVKLIRKNRPNLKIAIYGLPFRFYHPGQRKYNETDKLDNLLSYCDFITPSLYIMYANQQVGSQRNQKYLQDNLEVALSYGKRLNKPVVPFFWYRVHPGNKQFGASIISREEMNQYLRSLIDYNYKGSRIKGIIWWEGYAIIKDNKTGRQSQQLKLNNRPGALPSSVRDSIIINYTAPLMNNP